MLFGGTSLGGWVRQCASFYASDMRLSSQILDGKTLAYYAHKERLYQLSFIRLPGLIVEW